MYPTRWPTVYTTFLHKTKGRAEPGPTGSDDDGVVIVIDDGVLARDVLVHLGGALARRAPKAPRGRGGKRPAKVIFFF